MVGAPSRFSPTGKTYQSVYDARGQLFRDILPDGEFTEFVYRADGSLLTRTIPNGSIETHTYGTPPQRNAMIPKVVRCKRMLSDHNPCVLMPRTATSGPIPLCCRP